MKKTLLLLAFVVAMASCSSPKYAYYFSRHQQAVAKQDGIALPQMAAGAQRAEVLTASVSPVSMLSNETASVAPDFKSSAPELSKEKRAALRHDMKKAIAKLRVDKKMKSSLAAAKASGMDNDLKLAIIFGAVGIVGLIIGGNVFTVIGGIAMLIGVVFFVKWIIRQ